jgi:hypothetical protein
MRMETRMFRSTSAATLCVLMFAFPAAAHDHAGHARYHENFYMGLKQPGTGVSCCNNQDCRPAPHRVTPNGVEFFVGNRWFMPPADRLIETDVPGGTSSHWCGSGEHLKEPITFCAIVPRGGV